ERLLQGDHVGYFGELVATRYRSLRPYGTRGAVRFHFFEDEFDPAVVRCILLGRYFSSGDARYHKHQYTHRILRAKTHPDPFLTQCIESTLESIIAEQPTDLVACVPRRDRSKPHGLAAMVSQAFEEIAPRIPHQPRLACDLLECTSSIPQKSVPWTQRRENVRGKFRLRRR